jgi:hypothetical protein
MLKPAPKRQYRSGDSALSFQHFSKTIPAGPSAVLSSVAPNMMSSWHAVWQIELASAPNRSKPMSAPMENRKSDPDKGASRVDVEQLRRISKATIAHYDQLAESFWDGTRDHDVSQNRSALLDAIEGDLPYSILDLGCGPGRDLHHFRILGHDAVGLDGSKEFVAMARAYSGCEILHHYDAGS